MSFAIMKHFEAPLTLLVCVKIYCTLQIYQTFIKLVLFCWEEQPLPMSYLKLLKASDNSPLKYINGSQILELPSVKYCFKVLIII